MSLQSAVQFTISAILFLGAVFLSIVALTKFDSGVGPLFLVVIMIWVGLAFMNRNKSTHDQKNLTTTAGDAIAGGIFTVAIITGALSLVMLIYNSVNKPGTQKAQIDYSSMAHIKCKDYLKDRLKAPSSAEFPIFADKVTKITDNHYIIKSHVDAQNSFGANLRNDFYCDIELVGEYSGSNKNWILKDLRLSE